MLDTLQAPCAQARNNSAAALADLAKVICAKHSAVVLAFSNALEHALAAGRALIEAKELIGHGRWTKFLKDCDLGERQAERYMRLCRLAEANPTCKSDLTGLTIETAIRKLSPPSKAPVESKRSAPTIKPASKVVDPPKGRTTHLDILAAWMTANPAERQKAIDAIGLEPLLAVLPAAWWPLLEERFADRGHGSALTVITAPSAPTSDDLRIPDDLSIPPRLRRNSGARP
jgi:hypothetical protein